MDIDDDLRTWVVRYHLLMMIFVSLKDRGFHTQADRLFEITRDMRYEIADKVVHAVVNSLKDDYEYRLLFRAEEDNLYKSMLSDLCDGLPLQ